MHYKYYLLLYSFLALNSFYFGAQAADDFSKFKLLSSIKNIGGMGSVLIGNDEKGLEYVYTTHSAVPFQVIATDIKTGNCTTFNSPIDSEKEAYAIIEGPDNKIYIGTSPNGHLMRVNWMTKTLDDLGIPISTEKYILRLVVGSDKNIYGCTYPNAKLFRYNIVKNKYEDLGRMDPDEMYALTVGADMNGFIYVGVGYSKCHIVAYEIATGKFKDILPNRYQVPGYCSISKGKDGKIYGTVGNGQYYFSLNKWRASIVGEKMFVKNSDSYKLRNGNKVEINFKDNTIQLFNSQSLKTKKIEIKNDKAKIDVFRIGLGPDNNLYGGTELPFYFFKINAQDNTITDIGKLGEGEPYSFIPFDNKLMILTYTSLSPIMIYDPNKSFAPSNLKDGNPYLIYSSSISPKWRPFHAIMNKNRYIYIGSMNEYGKEGGAFTVFDSKSYKINVFSNIMGNQSIFSLCNLPDGNILGGTYNQGGIGSKITEKEAKIFIWDTKLNKKIFEMVPVPGQQIINAIIAGKKGLVYGFAGDTFFVFNLMTKKIIKTEKHNLGDIIYNALGNIEEQIYGVASNYIFRINQQDDEIEVLDKYDKPITGGFAVAKDNLYFISSSDIVSYKVQSK